jgi:CubicO group peptidase (beta-lactamase class C family)
MRFWLKVVTSIVFVAIGWTAALADEAQDKSTQVDSLFKEWDKATSPGCALSIMTDGHIVYERGYGMADLDHDIKITPTSVFHVASVSKQFTAASILILANEGKLSLDDEVGKYVSRLPDFGVPITIRHLLHHTSGLRDQWDLLGIAGWRYSLDLITDRDVLAVLSRQKKLNFTPGSEFLYSNTGFTLLAQIVQKVSGQSFRNFTRDRIFAPLGMTHTHFRDNHAEIVKDIAYGYRRAGDSFELSIPNFDTVGATSLLTTVQDLALWDENFYSHAVGGPTLAAQLEERGTLNDGTILNYAAGLEINTYRGQRVVEHSGGDAGYRAHLTRFSDQHFSIALLCNVANIAPAMLTRRIADIYLSDVLASDTGASPSAALAPLPGEQDLAKWVGLYTEHDQGDRVFAVSFNGGKLHSSLGLYGKALVMEATGAGRFRYPSDPRVEVVFQENDTEGSVALTTYLDGKKQHHYLRAPPYNPTDAELQQFVGTYRSDEVDMPYDVTIKGRQLSVHSLKSPDMILRPVAADLFDGGGARVRFTRNAEGAISGALLSTFRVYDLRFERSH